MEIYSVQEFIELIDKLEANFTHTKPVQFAENAVLGEVNHIPRFIYRGHSNSKEYSLLPGVLRWKSTKDTTEYSMAEFNILNDFISEASRYVTDISTDDIPAWLEVAQHFGVPTRLLDFTQNPLVSLYFACIDSTNTDAAVWIIDEPSFNCYFGETPLILAAKSKAMVSKIIIDEIISQDFKQHDSCNYIQHPWIYKPFYHEERMNMQSSVFMIWGAMRDEFTKFVKEENYMTLDATVTNKDKRFIACVKVPATAKAKILSQLSACGINEKFIYPGLDGIGRFIKKKYSSI